MGGGRQCGVKCLVLGNNTTVETRPQTTDLRTSNALTTTTTYCDRLKRPSDDKQLANMLANMLATNRTCLYSRQLFHQRFRVGKLVFDV